MKVRSIVMGIVAGAVGLYASTASAASVGTTTMLVSGWEVSWSKSQADSSQTYVMLTVLAADPGGKWSVLQKAAAFTAPVYSQDLGSVDLTFTQVSPNAATRLIITQENITNASGQAWSGFEFELVGGYSTPSVPYFDVAASFGSPTPFSTSPFTDVTTHVQDGQVRRITMGGGELADNEVWRPGASAGELVIVTNPSSASEPVQFTLRESPIHVPEPAAFLAFLAGVPLLARRRRQDG